MKRCHVCGNEYAGWRCPCRKKGRSQSWVSVGCGTRSWNVAAARARMLGGWGDYSAGPWAVAVDEADDVDAEGTEA